MAGAVSLSAIASNPVLQRSALFGVRLTIPVLRVDSLLYRLTLRAIGYVDGLCKWETVEKETLCAFEPRHQQAFTHLFELDEGLVELRDIVAVDGKASYRTLILHSDNLREWHTLGRCAA